MMTTKQLTAAERLRCPKCGREPETQIAEDPKQYGFPKLYSARLSCRGRFRLWSHFAGGWVDFLRDTKAYLPRERMLRDAWLRAVAAEVERGG